MKLEYHLAIFTNQIVKAPLRRAYNDGYDTLAPLLFIPVLSCTNPGHTDSQQIVQ
jgi:hypothetical protein